MLGLKYKRKFWLIFIVLCFIVIRVFFVIWISWNIIRGLKRIFILRLFIIFFIRIMMMLELVLMWSKLFEFFYMWNLRRVEV